MHRWNSLWLIAAGVLAVWGCRPIVVVEYWKPARINVARDIYQVAFVNFVESEDGEYLYRGVANWMEASGWYGISDFSQTQTAFRHSNTTSARSVASHVAARVCEAGSSRAILALEQLVSNKGTVSEGSMSSTVVRVPPAHLVSTNMTMLTWNRVLNATAHWVFYDCDGEVVETFTVKGINLGDIVYDSARHLVPEAGYYLTYLYVPLNGSSRQAARMYMAGKTEEAQAIWTSMLSDTNIGHDRAKVLHNIAVCFEARQLPEQALRSALASRAQWGNGYPMEDYIHHLQERAVQNDLFKQQLSGRKAARQR